MRRRPPRSTRTDTLFPYTTLVRSDRLTLQRDWLANISTDYRIEMGGDDEVVLSAGLFGKGKRLAATLNETTPTFLDRSEEHTSELQSLMRISYAVFCLKKNNNTRDRHSQLLRQSLASIQDKK